ncbi:hypothetical protein ANRL4_02915 [Anaerolineae bacterium]|nr:hypothetical protein ANRL4_02915 [Anaerolineae bacterium]
MRTLRHPMNDFLTSFDQLLDKTLQANVNCFYELGALPSFFLRALPKGE